MSLGTNIIETLVPESSMHESVQGHHSADSESNIPGAFPDEQEIEQDEKRKKSQGHKQQDSGIDISQILHFKEHEIDDDNTTAKDSLADRNGGAALRGLDSSSIDEAGYDDDSAIHVREHNSPTRGDVDEGLSASLPDGDDKSPELQTNAAPGDYIPQEATLRHTDTQTEAGASPYEAGYLPLRQEEGEVVSGSQRAFDDRVEAQSTESLGLATTNTTTTTTTTPDKDETLFPSSIGHRQKSHDGSLEAVHTLAGGDVDSPVRGYENEDGIPATDGRIGESPLDNLDAIATAADGQATKTTQVQTPPPSYPSLNTKLGALGGTEEEEAAAAANGGIHNSVSGHGSEDPYGMGIESPHERRTDYKRGEFRSSISGVSHPGLEKGLGVHNGVVGHGSREDEEATRHHKDSHDVSSFALYPSTGEEAQIRET